MLLIRGANVYPSQVQRSLLEVPGTGVEFKIVLTKRGALDHATVCVERDPGPPPDDDMASLPTSRIASAKSSRTTPA